MMMKVISVYFWVLVMSVGAFAKEWPVEATKLEDVLKPIDSYASSNGPQYSEYHVSKLGDDGNDGSQSSSFKTISAAANIARPGDVITVHEGTYREYINPPYGGLSEKKRITYQAAKGEKVAIKGSEIIKGWAKVQNDTWKVTIDNSFFGGFNPFNDLIRGDWFYDNGRKHHTGAVYQDGHWLVEAAKLEDVLKPIGDTAGSYSSGSRKFLLNVAWLRSGGGSQDDGRILATDFAAQNGIRTADCSEGGKCIGWIEEGDWVRYEKVDFGRCSEQIEIRAASSTEGGTIELRLDKPDGDLIGTCTVNDTGHWQAWSSFNAKIKPVSGFKTLCLVFKGPKSDDMPYNKLWFSQVNSSNTTVWAQFKDINPNEVNVEINVRQTVFYPKKPGINYITVRGFTMEHAATPWAPPTTEQVGLIGTHWSKGWIIENNTVRHSVCSGVALGKYGDEFDSRPQNSADGYVETINRALKRGWSRDNIGNHIVRNNHISHCGQAGIVGSMGAVFSTVTGNEIHDIHLDRAFGGVEMAGIKFHGPIDTVISNNHIYRCGGYGGIWLDWMTQGTRVSGNLLHDNTRDIFVEVNHGPFLVDNNIFLSQGGLLESSGGGAYVHNLFGCKVQLRPERVRQTPFHKQHSTKIAGLSKVVGDDERFYNNIFVGEKGLVVYDSWRAIKVQAAGNIHLDGAKPHNNERESLVVEDFGADIKLQEKSDGWWLEMAADSAWNAKQKRNIITTETLGKAQVPNLSYVKPDGTSYRIDTDYFGKKRYKTNLSAGPFADPGEGELVLKVWPVE
jgi:alpha-N-arabinofuranosidase